MKKTLLSFLAALAFLAAQAQPALVQKTNTIPLYVHYMPWFESPQTSGTGQWGWHWTMDNRNPNIVDASGKRQIASHYYPLIGPYASSDPHVVEYHLLLMKLAGIDGVLVDWYGSAGTNGDLGNLLRNSNALINRTDETGLKFGLILEDRFTGSVANGRTNMDYARTNYFNRPEYIRYGPGNDPLVGIFGPITFTQPSQWTDILSAAGEDVEFLTLWDNNNAGTNADGQYVWPWEDENLDNYYPYMEAYYRDRAPSKKTVLGVAYPGFRDFYAQGQNGGVSYFDIPHNNGQTLNQMLGLINQYRANIDMLQLATWNDFGEGTIFEPTQETGFSYLVRIQQYTGVPYTENDLRQVLRLYNLRKQYASDAGKQSQLNQAFNHFVALRITDAVAMLNTVEGTTPPPATGQPIPGTIQAESYAAMSGVLTENTSDAGGGLNVNYFDTNDWLEYTVNVATAGSYTVGFRVASAYGGAQLQLRNSAGASLGSVNVGNTGGWQSWTTINTTVPLPAGAQRLRVHAQASSGCNLNWVSFTSATTPPASFTRLLQAEAFNVNNGMTAESCTDTGGGQNMGYVDNGDYLVFNAINFPTTGAYLIEYRVASGGGGGTVSCDLNAGAIQLGSTTVPGTGGWQTWTTVSRTVNVNAGTYNFGIYAQVGGWNVNWIRISKVGSARAAQPASPSTATRLPTLSLYPNPATDRVQLQAGPELTGSVYQILDAYGTVKSHGILGANELDVSSLRPGLYTLLVITKERQKITRQLIKQ